jgi:hypothetical protein
VFVDKAEPFLYRMALVRCFIAMEEDSILRGFAWCVKRISKKARKSFITRDVSGGSAELFPLPQKDAEEKPAGRLEIETPSV